MVRMIKRTNVSKRQSALIRLSAVVLALLCSSLFILLMGHNPIKVYV